MLAMKDVKVVAFDCDGVLFDTEQSNRAYYNAVLNHLGLPDLTAEQFAYVHMHTVDESLAFLFKDSQRLAEAYAYRKTVDYSQFIKLMQIEPDLFRLLNHIRPQFKTAIATNRTDSVNGLLAEFELGGLFDLVVSSSDVSQPKPHPDSLLKILKHFGVQPDEAIYVGDSNVDEMAAHSAGVPLVAFRNPALSSAYHIDRLRELEAILCISSEPTQYRRSWR
jgi:HAD superfamily hydrolase (TIGR01509 family)